MSDYATRYRNSAENCRRVAKDERDETSRRELYQLAVELDAQADRIDAEENNNAGGRETANLDN